MGMATELNLLPTSLIAGETINVVITPPSSADTVKYQFASAVPLEVSVTEALGVWTLTVSSAQTIAFKRGAIQFYGFSTDDDDVVTCFDSGIINVSSSPMATSEYSTALASVRLAIQKWGSSENQTIQIGELRFDCKSLDELLKLEDYYKRLVALDTGTSNYSGGPIRILTRF